MVCFNSLTLWVYQIITGKSLTYEIAVSFHGGANCEPVSLRLNEVKNNGRIYNK
tara:strand:+ start:2042 stop:2203 length:162 start_codon:yes stop_codon:yes gene_type:complete